MRYWTAGCCLLAVGCGGGATLEQAQLGHVVSVSAMATVAPDEHGSFDDVGRAIAVQYMLVNESKFDRRVTTFAAGLHGIVASPRENETHAGAEYTHYITARLVDKPLAPYASLGLGVLGEVGGVAADIDGDGEVDPDTDRTALSWHAAGGIHGFAGRVYWAADLGYQGGPLEGMRTRAALGYLIGAN